PVVVGERRMVDRVVLDIEPLKPELGAQPARVQERSEAGKRAGIGLALDRQQLAVTPEVMRARRDRRARNRRANPGVVVADLERAEAVFAYVQRLDRVFLPALAALQVGDVVHRMFLTGCALRPDARRRAPRRPHIRTPPASQRIASAASISPITAATGPIIPASRQLAISAVSGGSSNRQRKQAVRPASTVIAWPVIPSTPAYTKGLPSARQTSLIRNLAAGSSVASITKS